MTEGADTRSPWNRWSWVIAAIWLVFLAYPVMETFQADAPGWAKGITLALFAAFAALYVLGFAVLNGRELAAWCGLVLLAVATVPVIGIEAVGVTPYLGAFSALLVPPPWWRWTTLASALLPLLSLVAGDFPAFFFLMVWPIIGFCVAIRIFTGLEEKAVQDRQRLSLVAERERVARDVHDVLGHSLTALSVKAELAGRLLDVDPDRARAELASIQDTARQALAEVRATVGGLRAGNLVGELESAVTTLADSGIASSITGTVADTDPRHRTLLAWVLREAVTNVIRHSGATSVVIALDPNGLSVTDDGVGRTGPDGNGLRGMRERVSAAGGTLEVSGGSPESNGTSVQVVLP